MIVYGLCANKQAGKDTFANIACNILDGENFDTLDASFGLSPWQTCAFANPLKQFAVDYLGIPASKCYGGEEEKNEIIGTWGMFGDYIRTRFFKDKNVPISVREVLQVVGTEVFRECFRRTFWVDLMKRNLQRFAEDNVKVVFVTDCRFRNEIKMIKDLSGKIIRIIRPIERKNQIVHLSETEMNSIPDEDFDYVINNDGSIEDYENKIRNFLTQEGWLCSAENG